MYVQLFLRQTLVFDNLHIWSNFLMLLAFFNILVVFLDDRGLLSMLHESNDSIVLTLSN